MILTIFFLIFLFLSLFLGEYKQGPIEIYWALSLCLLVVITVIKKQKIGVEKKIHYLLIFTIFASCITIWFSQSLGYSLSVIIRLLAGIVAFLLFSTNQSKQELKTTSVGLLGIGCVAAFGAILYRIFPHASEWMTSDNLIFSRSPGHNEGVYILMFVFPLMLMILSFKKTWVYTAIFILFLTAIFVSFSRGALLLTIGYLLFTLNSHIIHKKLRFLFTTGIIVTVFLMTLFFVISMLPEPIRTTLPLSSSIKDQIIKSTPLNEPRIYAWRQAIQGFTTHPIIGTGPGTYIFTSKRFQVPLLSAATYAHSYPLQLLSEQGVLGMIPFVLLCIVVGKWLIHLRRLEQNKKTNLPSSLTIGLIDGVLLVCVHSVIDYNLDYLSIWVIIWAVSGMLISKMNPKKNSCYPLLIVLSIPLFLYSASSILGNKLWNVQDTNTKGFYFTSFNVNRAQQHIQNIRFYNRPIPPFDLKLIQLFHRDSPPIQFALAELKETSFDEPIVTSLYKQAIAGEPFNGFYVAKYMQYLLQKNNKQEVSQVYEQLVKNAYALQQKQYPSDISLQDPVFIDSYTPEFAKLLEKGALLHEIVAKSLYFLGLSQLETNTEATNKLWLMAETISPGWSLFYIERASYALYVEKNEAKAKEILLACEKIYSPSKACTEVLSTFPNLPLPGAYKDAIRAIPRY